MAWMDFVPGINRDYIRELREASGLAADPDIVEATAQVIYERFCEEMDAFFDTLPDGVEIEHARLLGGNDWLYEWGPRIHGEPSVVWVLDDWVEHAREYLNSHGAECYGIDADQLASTMFVNTNLRRMREDQTAVGWDYVHFSVEHPAVRRWIAETGRHNLAIDIQEAIQGPYEARDAYDPGLDPEGLGPVAFFVQEVECMLATPEGRDGLAERLSQMLEEEAPSEKSAHLAAILDAIEALPVDQARERPDDSSQEVAR